MFRVFRRLSTNRAAKQNLQPQRIMDLFHETPGFVRISAGAAAERADFDVGMKRACMLDFVVHAGRDPPMD